jgi:hypothetical protein
VQRKTRGRAVRYSFLVGLFHSLLHAGLSRRTALAIFHQVNEIYSRVNCVFEEKSNDAAVLQA